MVVAFTFAGDLVLQDGSVFYTVVLRGLISVVP